MGQVEELPDDFDESLNLNEAPPETTAEPPKNAVPAEEELAFPINEERLKEMEAQDPTAPKMPPNMASVRTHTTDELADMLNKTPLFMTDINKAGDESESTFSVETMSLQRRKADVA